MSAVIVALKDAGKIAAGAVPAALLARLGLPALGGVLFLAVLVLAVACWVIGSGDRAERVSRMLLAWRGNADCIAQDTVPATRSPRRLSFRRS